MYFNHVVAMAECIYSWLGAVLSRGWGSRRYTAPPELFTMYACLFADAAVQKVSTNWLLSNEAVLHSTCVSYAREHGFPPHPGVLMEIVRVNLKQG
jgi:hypothetical protein